MKHLIILSTLLLGFICEAQNVAPAKAAELSTHRIERLVLLKKIDESFQSKFYSIQLTPLKQEAAIDPAFKSVVSQYPGADGTYRQLEILMDGQGKAISNSVKDASPAALAPVWPDLDPVSLVENSLHYVLEVASTKADEKTFFTDFSSVLLTQITLNGQILSRAEIHSSQTVDVLEVFLKPDGTLNSTNVIKN